MKIQFIILVASLLGACQPGKKEAKAPENIQEAFKKLHPNAKIYEWKDESPTWEAKYEEGDTKGAVSFDANGNVTEAELVIPESQLPDLTAITDYINTNFGGEKIQRCEKITQEDGTVTYELQITGRELVFDADGKFLEVEPG